MRWPVNRSDQVSRNACLAIPGSKCRVTDHVTTLFTRSQTAQPSGSNLQALWITTQSTGSLIGWWGSYPSIKVQLAYSTDPVDKACIIYSILSIPLDIKLFKSKKSGWCNACGETTLVMSICWKLICGDINRCCRSFLRLQKDMMLPIKFCIQNSFKNFVKEKKTFKMLLSQISIITCLIVAHTGTSL